MDPITFEPERLTMFARYGFDGEGRWITDQSGRRTYLIGRGSGPCPTLLIHGGLSQAGEWAPLAGHLDGPVLIPDRPGCGLTYLVDYRGRDFRQEAVDWTRGVADGCGCEQVDIVGNSIGGYFGIAFALAHPERVRHLVLVGAPAGLARDVPMMLRLWATPGPGQLISRIRTTDPEVNRKRVFSMLVAHPEAVAVDIIETDIAAAALPGVAGASYTMLRTVGTLRGWRRRFRIDDDMARLTVPTLFLWGDAERFVQMKHGRRVAATMPHAEFTVIKEGGHVLQLDQPAAVAAEITRFVSRTPGG